MKSYVWRSYRGKLIAGAVLVVLIALMQGITKCSSPLDVMRVLCDAFTLSGGIILCIGGLCWVSSTGMFDPLVYTTRKFGQMFVPADQRSEETMEEYIERKRSQPVALKPFFAVGGIYFAVGMIFLGVFYYLY